MQLIDSNILIYAGNPQFNSILLPFVSNSQNSVSVISQIETLGFHLITPPQIIFFESLFKVLNVIPLDNMIIQEAIKIRQLKKISLGDAIIASTALVRNLEIITRNTSDFTGIPGLKYHNPIP